MHRVGTETMTVVDGAAAPAGVRHAVAGDGLMLCRPLRPHYTWPALDWTTGDDACGACAAVREELAVPTYPDVEGIPPQPQSSLETAEW
jgi:hypothetical protein